MNKILSNIRAVRGVTGTLAIDKKRALTYQMLPANFEAEAVKNIAVPLLNLANTSDKAMVVDLFFENGKARIYNRPEAVVMIIGRDELNLDVLGSVCKEAILAICRRFSKGELSDNSAAKKGNMEVSFSFLLAAINIIAFNVQQKIGAYLVTKHLRNSKDQLVGKYSYLSSVSVDNNGVASLIKGYTPYSGAGLLEGFAHWANLFVSSCASSSNNKLSTEDILQLTLDIKSKLELTGFYQLYSEVSV